MLAYCMCLLTLVLLLPAVSMAASITTCDDFKQAMVALQNSRGEATVIELSGEINLEGWASYNYYDYLISNTVNVTVKGTSSENPAILTNLNYPLIEELGYNSSVTFENIIIKDSNITSPTADAGAAGAFVGWSYSGNLTFRNCEVLNSTIGKETSDCQYAGGLCGLVSGKVTDALKIVL